jgi:UDP-2,3-diacylglucosamine hydrolase
MADKTAEIMDASAEAVVQRMRRAGAQRLVHGHTHRPADHALLIDGHRCIRHVLADWHAGRGEVLVHDARGWHREPVRDR